MVMQVRITMDMLSAHSMVIVRKTVGGRGPVGKCNCERWRYDAQGVNRSDNKCYSNTGSLWQPCKHFQLLVSFQRQYKRALPSRK
jgi:hypothetical protein